MNTFWMNDNLVFLPGVIISTIGVIWFFVRYAKEGEPPSLPTLLTYSGIVVTIVFAFIAGNYRTQFTNDGAPLTVKPISISYNSTYQDYDVAFSVLGSTYRTSFDHPIAVVQTSKSALATVQYQTNRRGDSRYIVTNVQEPSPSGKGN